MTGAQALFFEILSDHIHGRNTHRQLQDDYNEITRYALNHQLTPIIYYQIKQIDESGELKTNFASQVYNYVSWSNILCILGKTLCGFDFITYKGASISKVYPVPALRTMGDIDILIHEACFCSAKKY